MAVGFVPAFEPKIGMTFEGDGASLYHSAVALDEIAEQQGLPLLTSFTDEREPPPDFDGFPEELGNALGPWTAWFSATEGLTCVEGLLAALEEPLEHAGLPLLEGIIDDLEALQAVLIVAKKKNARFRLEIG